MVRCTPGRASPWYQLTRGGSAVTFKEVLAHVIDWLQQDQRLSYRALKRQFALDDDYLEDLKVELIEVLQVALDQDGKILVWSGAAATVAATAPSQPVPLTYTPPHLAPLYTWFTEGFETADLTEAKVLLEELGSQP